MQDRSGLPGVHTQSMRGTWRPTAPGFSAAFLMIVLLSMQST
jgi:hypothetical protein